MTTTDKERATLRALAQALTFGDAVQIRDAAQQAFDAMPRSVQKGEVGVVFHAIKRYAERVDTGIQIRRAKLAKERKKAARRGGGDE